LSQVEEKFAQHAIVEIMGHQRFAGYVTEQVIGWASLIRVDVPEVTDAYGRIIPAFTKMFGAGSIYSITPVSEDLANLAAARLHAEPINIYIPQLYRPEAPPALAAGPDDVDDDCQDDEDDGDAFR
jgi:hypothetical protein